MSRASAASARGCAKAGLRTACDVRCPASRPDLARAVLDFQGSLQVWDLWRQRLGDQMYVEFGPGGQILAAYLAQQYPGQRWLAIGNRSLQAFLAAAPTVAKDPMGRRGFRRSSSAYRFAA